MRAAGEGSRPLGPGGDCPQPSAPPPGHSLVSLSTRAAPHVTLCLGLSGATCQASLGPQKQAAECGWAGSFAKRKPGLASPTPRLEVSCHLTCPTTLCLCAPSGRESPVLFTPHKLCSWLPCSSHLELHVPYGLPQRTGEHRARLRGHPRRRLTPSQGCLPQNSAKIPYDLPCPRSISQYHPLLHPRLRAPHKFQS